MVDETNKKFRHPELPPLPEEKPRPKTIVGRISSVISGIRSYVRANQYSDGLTPEIADDIMRLYNKELDALRKQGFAERLLDPDERTKVLDETIDTFYPEIYSGKDEMAVRRIRIQLLEKAGLVPRAM